MTIAVGRPGIETCRRMIARLFHGSAGEVTKITIRRAFGRDSAGDLAEPTSGGSAATNGRGPGTPDVIR